MRTRLGRFVGILASAFAALGVLGPVATKVREFARLHVVDHYALWIAWEALCLSLVFIAFLWVHLDWKVKSLRWTGCALGVILAIVSPVAGAIVWMRAPEFWIVWPTYGQCFLYGICLLVLATSNPWRKVPVAVMTATTGGLVLCMPDEIAASENGLYATGTFFVFLWLVGMILSRHGLVGRVLRTPFVCYLWVHAVLPPSSQLGYMCLAAVLLTEVRTILEPPNAGVLEERDRTDEVKV